VIVASLDVKVEAFRQIYAPFGPSVEKQAIDHYIHETGVPRLLRFRHCHKHLLGQDPTDAEVQALSDRFGGMVEDLVVACDGVPGVHDFLEAVPGRIPCFVVSATPDDELKRIVRRRGLDRYFAAVHGSPPDKPEVLSRILAERGWRAAATLMIGDGLADHRAATANGIRFVGRTHASFENPFPEGTVTLDDLTGLAKTLNLE
jgi:phosphoglycolate phosphatase-like HAD superfamily hydrolase